ncbi:MAG: PIG-L family deacetylase [Streptococcaceae bacterium]|jgi:LmbE family N-acetylglucosaminyl deacetylase|nr:PIG-L family deacetylase [Streptococcaceae bacterium]
MKKRIVSVGAHSLDAELMGGPLLIKYAEAGAKCSFVHVTTGRLEDPFATEEAKTAYLNQLKEENQEAAERMGCNYYSYGYHAETLPNSTAFVALLKKYFVRENVDLVISHARGTMHPRHYYTYECVTEAVRQLKVENMDIDLLYGENCEDLAGFTPTKYVECTESQVEKWFHGLSAYAIFRGEVNDTPYYAYYSTMGKVRAMEIGSKNFIKAYMAAPMIDNKM